MTEYLSTRQLNDVEVEKSVKKIFLRVAYQKVLVLVHVLYSVERHLECSFGVWAVKVKFIFENLLLDVLTMVTR